MWFFAILVVLAMGGIAVLAAGKGTPLADVYDDRPDALVPAEGPLSGEDLRRVRFSLAFRGYRMSEVDALLQRLAREHEARDATAAPDASDPSDPSDPSDLSEQSDVGVTPEGRGGDTPD